MFFYPTCVFLVATFSLASSQVGRSNPCDLPGGVVAINFLVDPTSCSNFIRCVGKIPQRMACAPGTLFNTRISMCDHPKNVDCDELNRPVIPNTTPVSSPIPTVTIDNDQMVQKYYEHWYKFYCTEYGSNNVIRWPHPNDCSRFYQCRQRQLTSVRCPSYPHQMLYNRTIQNCDLPHRVRCDISPPFGNDFASANNEELQYRSLCKPDALYFQRWSNSHDCRRFYQCINGHFTHEICSIRPTQLVYNAQTLTCQRPLPGDLCVLNWTP